MVHTPSPLIADPPPVASPPAKDVVWVTTVDGGFAAVAHIMRFVCSSTKREVTLWLVDSSIHRSEDEVFFPPVVTPQQEPPDAG